MKIIILYSVIILVAITNIYSQDLIVTNESDSINCKITKTKFNNLYFTFKYNDEIRSTLIPLSQVKYYKIDFYKNSIIPEEEIVGFTDYSQFRLAINSGFSYQTARINENIPADFETYVNEMKSGYHFGADLTYFFSEPLGFGFKYYLFKTSNSMDNIYVEYPDGSVEYGIMSDDLTISFIGPTFSTRLLNYNKSNAFLMSLSIGYMGYSNNKVIVNNYIMTGNTVGMTLDVGYDIGISDKLSLGFQISLITGTLTEYELDNGSEIETIKLENGEFESVNRIDLSVGLRFHK